MIHADTLYAQRSLHPHVFAQIRRDVEVLAFHYCRLAFFKTTACDRFELQHFLFGLHGFFSSTSSSLAGAVLSSGRAGRWLGRVDNLERARADSTDGAGTFSTSMGSGSSTRSRLRRLKILDRRRFGLDLNFWRTLVRLFPHRRHWRRAARRNAASVAVPIARPLRSELIIVTLKRLPIRPSTAVPKKSACGR